MQWKFCLILAALVFFPAEIRCDENEEEEEATQPDEVTMSISMMPNRRMSTTPALPAKVQLECYTCTFNDRPEACLDPVKYRMMASKCQGVDDKCYTMLKTKRNITMKMSPELVMDRDEVADLIRGCMKHCNNTESVQCCDLNRCNYRPFNVKTRRAMSRSLISCEPSIMVIFVATLLLKTSSFL